MFQTPRWFWVMVFAFFGVAAGGLLYMALFTDVRHRDINSLPLVFWLFTAVLIVLSVGILPLRAPFERPGPGDYKRHLVTLGLGIFFVVASLLNIGNNGGSTVLMAVTGILNLTFFLRVLLYNKAKIANLK
ncbi:MAG TPA: hypothetical protein VEW94_00685 [Chloroflexia bacterium]|nr:hypothetical protein [Chloroflexia bacterium]